MDLFLHIGTEKTGSTSFQVWGAQNRDALRRQGICYARAPGETAHLDTYLWTLDNFSGSRDQTRRGIANVEDWAAFRRTFPDRLSAEISAAEADGCTACILSCELLHSRLPQEDLIGRLHHLLVPLFDRITVLCWLRPQIDVVVSHMSTVSRTHAAVRPEFVNRATPASAYYNYEDLVDRWSTVFGPDALCLIPYRTGPDPIAYICDRLQLDPTALRPARRMNTPRDIRSIRIANSVRYAFSVEGHAAVDYLHDILDALPCTDPPNPGHALAREVQNAFADSNARLAGKRDDIMAQDLEPDWSRYAGEGNLHLLNPDDDMAGHLAALLLQASRREAALDLRLKLLRAETLLEKGQPETARPLLAKAERAATRIPDFDSAEQTKPLRRRLRQLARRLNGA